MSSGFDKILEIGDKINYSHNSETVNFSFNNLTENHDISVIFERSKEIITIQGETEVVSFRPVAYVQHRELSDLNLPIPKVRDQLTVQGVIYDIAAVPNDGHNETEMHLIEA